MAKKNNKSNNNQGSNNSSNKTKYTNIGLGSNSGRTSAGDIKGSGSGNRPSSKKD